MSTGKNRKKILIVGWMPQAGIEVIKKRDDVDYEVLPLAEVAGSYHKKLADANAVTLGGTPYKQAELDVSPVMEVVARLGVGFDQVEVPALSKRKIPLMTTGIANSVSVAEHAMYMLLASARLNKKMDRFVREGSWSQRLTDLPVDLAGKSILVADDDTYSRLVAKAYLERCGATVVEAEHGQAVLARLQQHSSIDAIVMDMNMPGMGGVETTALIRVRADSYADVPIIALTSQSDIEAVQTCLAAGMNEVMVKPVQVGSLYASLARQFARQRALKAPTQADPSQPPTMPIGKHETIADSALLDEKHLDELVALDLLDQTFVNGIEQIRLLVARLATSAAAHDLKSTHEALHLLLGVSGNIGAKALHQFARQIYPRMIEGEWPVEADWLARISMLGERSADALHAYFVSARARGGQRDVLSDG